MNLFVIRLSEWLYEDVTVSIVVSDVAAHSCSEYLIVSPQLRIGLQMACGRCQMFDFMGSANGREEYAQRMRTVINQHVARYAERDKPLIQKDASCSRSTCPCSWYRSLYFEISIGHYDYVLN